MASELLKRNLRIEPGKSKLMQTRREVERGWRATSDILIRQGQSALAAELRSLMDKMVPPRSEKEQIADGILERASELRVRHQHLSR